MFVEEKVQVYAQTFHVCLGTEAYPHKPFLWPIQKKESEFQYLQFYGLFVIPKCPKCYKLQIELEDSQQFVVLLSYRTYATV